MMGVESGDDISKYFARRRWEMRAVSERTYLSVRPYEKGNLG
jgi:hypothetical protein